MTSFQEELLQGVVEIVESTGVTIKEVTEQALEMLRSEKN